MRLCNVSPGYAEVLSPEPVLGTGSHYLGCVERKGARWVGSIYLGGIEYVAVGLFSTRREAAFAVYNEAQKRPKDSS